MKFKLEIELGNAAMLTSEDLADAVKKIAGRILRSGMVSCQQQEHGGTTTFKVKDANGNVVGEWSLEGTLPSDDEEEEDLTDECSQCGGEPHEPNQDCEGER